MSVLSRPASPVHETSGADAVPDGSRPGPAARPGEPAPSTLRRSRRVAVCLGFLALTLSQRPGLLVPDTKLDLVVDPWGFLARALGLWEPDGFAGQVQNQAYGYLFPMGPFFGIGHSLGVPAWIVQRAWVALVLAVAFLGFLALAERLRIGSPAGRFVAALGYALAPRVMGVAGTVSIEAWPLALAPWVLIGLVAASAGATTARRGAALSGVAVFCVGGVNAAATAAVLPAAALWILTRPRGLRGRLAAWWAGAVLLATLWWVLPLLLLGRYSPPFLDWIESASTTTSTTDLTATLRGVSQWMSYLADLPGPLSPAGWSVAHDVLPILASVALAAAGLAALTRSDLPERLWIGSCLVTGTVLVAAGWTGPFDGVLAEGWQQLLDGPAAPLRNVHKYDPVLRIALLLGVAHLIGVATRAVLRADGRRVPLAPVLAPVLAVLAVLGVAAPAVRGELAPATGYSGIPGYWQQTADWLGAHAAGGRALLVPGSTFGVYTWGSPADEPLQPLATSPWDVRSVVPLTDAGHIRMLDAVERRLAEGRGSPGLADYLARSGFSHLVVRNDLDRGAANIARPAAVHRALADSPGLTRVASFGPEVFGSTALPGVVLDAGTLRPVPAVEVWSVAGTAPRAYTAPLSDTLTVTGGPGELLALEDRGTATGRPAVLADGGPPASPDPALTVAGDGFQRREHGFGAVTDADSAALTDDDPLRRDGPVADYPVGTGTTDAAQRSTVETLGGRVGASGSASDVDSAGGTRPDRQPYAALDGDPATAWRGAATLERAPVWWRVDLLSTPVTAPSVRVVLDPEVVASAPARIRVTTDAGEHEARLDRTTAPQDLPLPPGPTRSLTLTVDPAPGAAFGPVLGLSEVTLPGVRVERTVRLPPSPGPAGTYAFDAAVPGRPGCLTVPVGDRPGVTSARCNPDLVRGPEEAAGLDRTFTVAPGGGGGYRVAVTATPRPGPELDGLISRAGGPAAAVAEASSRAVPDPRGGPGAAVDGDPGTSWTADTEDPDPTLTVSWRGERTVDRIRVVRTPGTPAALPTAVTVSAGGQERTTFLGPDGTATFAPLRTDRISLTFPLREELSSFDQRTRVGSPLGVGVSEVQVPGVPTVPARAPVRVGCGGGPTVTVDGVPRATAFDTTVGALRALLPLPLRLCGAGDPAAVALGPGQHRFVADRTPTTLPVSATLTRDDAAVPPPAGRTPVTGPVWSDEHRVLDVPARSSETLLVVGENANPGWVASTAGGPPLPARTVDGWQQAWLLPPGPATTVTLEFTPGPWYRGGLLAGALAVVALLGLAAWPRRRTPTAHRPGPVRAGAVAGVALVLGAALVAGAAGAVAVGATVAGIALARSAWSPRTARWAIAAAAALPLVAAGALLVVLPDVVAARQLCAALALGATVAALLSTGPPAPEPEPDPGPGHASTGTIPSEGGRP